MYHDNLKSKSACLEEEAPKVNPVPSVPIDPLVEREVGTYIYLSHMHVPKGCTYVSVFTATDRMRCR